MKILTSIQETELELISDLLMNWKINSSVPGKRKFWEEQAVMKICDFAMQHKDNLF